ncbi:hypothetical protein GGR51DRAFT_506728 [Nemania sp. FL0031]|nr:hypothetical protein GGR51DRAFT_506728 [Nemania sp. FL0031]
MAIKPSSSASPPQDWEKVGMATSDINPERLKTYLDTTHGANYKVEDARGQYYISTKTGLTPKQLSEIRTLNNTGKVSEVAKPGFPKRRFLEMRPTTLSKEGQSQRATSPKNGTKSAEDESRVAKPGSLVRPLAAEPSHTSPNRAPTENQEPQAEGERPGYFLREDAPPIPFEKKQGIGSWLPLISIFKR